MAEPVVGIVAEADFSDALKEQKKLAGGFNQVEKAVRNLQKGLDDTNKSIKTITASQQAASKVQEERVAAIKLQTQALKTQEAQVRAAAQTETASARKIASANQLQVEQLRNQRAAIQQSNQAQREAVKAARKAADAQRKATRDLDKQAEGWIKLAKKAALWALGARTVFRLIFRLRTEFGKAFRTVFENTEEYERLTQAVKEASAAFILFLFPAEKTKDIFDKLAVSVGVVSEGLLRASAIIQAYKETTNSAIPVILNLGRSFLVAGLNAEKFNATFAALEEVRLGPEGVERFGDVFRHELEKQQAALDAATTEAKDYGSTIKSLIGIQRQFNDFLAQQDVALREAQAEFASAASTARATFMGDITKIDRDFNKRIVEINKDTNDKNEKALSRFHKRVAQIQKRANKNLERERQRHQLEMAFAQRRFLLTGIQNERMFLFERGRLVAQGDVLAIQELDARNELQKEAAEENFRLQMELSEAQFRLQQRIQRETNRELIADLRVALSEQFQAIEEERKEEIQEARDAATEQKTEAAKAAGERFADAALALQAEEKQLEEALERKTEATAQGIVDLTRKLELGVEDAVDIWEMAFGKDAEMERLIRETFDATEQEAQMWSDFLIQRMKAVEQQALSTAMAITSLSAIPSSPDLRAFQRRRRSPGLPTTRGRQFGGEDIVSTPTAFIAGEAHMPERVTVEPLSSIGGSFSIGWRGGAIPINVSGGTEGADMAPIGQEIAQGLIIELQNRLASFRGTRGR